MRMTRLLVTVAAVAATLAVVPSAGAAEPIEGSWFYNGGEVLVEATGPGTYKGTVVKPTQFSSCIHPAGQVMWAIDGTGLDYTGTHVWFNTATCSDNPGGLSTWKITSTDPANFLLRFCSVVPGGGPPTFDPAGNPTGGTDCDELKRTLPPQPKPTFTNVVTLPKASKQCRSRRNFRIRLRAPKADALVTASVLVNGRRVRLITGARLRAPVDLRGLPKGRYTVKITARTVSGVKIQGTRRYRTCVAKRRG